MSKILISANHATARRFVLTAVGVATLSSFAINAQAGDAAPQVSVSYQSLDLSKQADAQVLYSRLRAAARIVCRQFEGFELSRVRQHEACYDQALSNAVAAVDHANLTALYRSDETIRLALREDARSRS